MIRHESLLFALWADWVLIGVKWDEKRSVGLIEKLEKEERASECNKQKYQSSVHDRSHG